MQAFYEFVMKGGDAAAADMPPERRMDDDRTPLPGAYLRQV